MLRTKLLQRTPGFLATALAAGVACAGPFALTPSVSAKTHEVHMTAVETEVVVDGDTGRLVPARDARAMAEALLNMAVNAEHANRMAANGRRRVEQHFSIEQMVDRYAAVYRDFGGR